MKKDGRKAGSAINIAKASKKASNLAMKYVVSSLQWHHG